MGRKGVSFVVTVVAALTGCSQQQQKEPPLTPEGKAYVRHLPLSEVTMKSAESYARQTLTEVEGKVQNNGDRTVSRVDVYCMFYDGRGMLVLKERAGLIKNVLKPGETRHFRLAFDDIPESWNNQMPSLVIAQVIFG